MVESDAIGEGLLWNDGVGGMGSGLVGGGVVLEVVGWSGRW